MDEVIGRFVMNLVIVLLVMEALAWALWVLVQYDDADYREDCDDYEE